MASVEVFRPLAAVIVVVVQSWRWMGREGCLKLKEKRAVSSTSRFGSAVARSSTPSSNQTVLLARRSLMHGCDTCLPLLVHMGKAKDFIVIEVGWVGGWCLSCIGANFDGLKSHTQDDITLNYSPFPSPSLLQKTTTMIYYFVDHHPR